MTDPRSILDHTMFRWADQLELTSIHNQVKVKNRMSSFNSTSSHAATSNCPCQLIHFNLSSLVESKDLYEEFQRQRQRMKQSRFERRGACKHNCDHSKLLNNTPCTINEICDIPCKGNTSLHRACRVGDFERVASILHEVESDSIALENILTARNECGLTPLHCSVLGSQSKCVRLILQNGRRLNPELNVDEPDARGHNPLAHAVVGYNLDICRLLLDYGAKIIFYREDMTLEEYASNETIQELLTGYIPAIEMNASQRYIPSPINCPSSPSFDLSRDQVPVKPNRISLVSHLGSEIIKQLFGTENQFEILLDDWFVGSLSYNMKLMKSKSVQHEDRSMRIFLVAADRSYHLICTSDWGDMLEAISLERCSLQSVVKDDKIQFQINSMGGMKLILTCDDSNTRDHWVDLVRDAIGKAKKQLLCKLEQTVPRRRSSLDLDKRTSVLLHSIVQVAVRGVKGLELNHDQYSSMEVFLLPDRLLYGSDNLILQLTSIQKSGTMQIDIHSLKTDGKSHSISIRFHSIESTNEWFEAISECIETQKRVLSSRLQSNVNVFARQSGKQSREQPPNEDCGHFPTRTEPDILHSCKVKVKVLRRGRNEWQNNVVVELGLLTDRLEGRDQNGKVSSIKLDLCSLQQLGSNNSSFRLNCETEMSSLLFTFASEQDCQIWIAQLSSLIRQRNLILAKNLNLNHP